MVIMNLKKLKLSDKDKFNIVIEGIKGRSVTDICLAYNISQTHYYRLRDRFFAKGQQVFNLDKISNTETKLNIENRKLKQCVAELTLELKKNEEW